jgi:hypothetical protein
MGACLSRIVGWGLAVIASALATPALIASAAQAYTDGPYTDVYYVNSCATSGAPANSAAVFSPTKFGFMTTAQDCLSGLAGLQIDAGGTVNNGDSGNWSAITPTPGMRIVGVNAFGYADCGLHHDGFNASYFYGDNGTNYGVPQISVNCGGSYTGSQPAGNLNGFIQPSRYFGFQASCQKSGGCQSSSGDGLVFGATGITLAVQETSGPSLAALAGNNLYYQSGWVRGTFPASLSASDPSGACALQTTVNGQVISSYSDPSRDTSQWSQCHGSQITASVDTTRYPDGAAALTLGYSATNAAGAVSSASRAIDVDNVAPSVSLSAPADTASVSGTQDVTVTGSAGPSGVAAIVCSVDGGALQTHSGASAQVAVVGIGSHQVTCYDRNNAVNSSGVAATSAPQTLDLSIRQPTAEAITFARIADALRCRTAIERVKVAGRIRTVRRHGKRVRIRGHARTVRRRVRKCHARTVVRTVRVILKHHGKPVRRHGKPVYVKRRVRRVLLPHIVDQPTRRIGHGKHTTVSGLLELADGTALAGQTVQVLASPNDNAPRFHVMRTVTTNANGLWTAKVGPGPSRLIEAVYPGSATTEPAVSSTVTLTVPARIAFSISPRTVPWRAAIRLHGRLVGGYVPRDGVALRLLVHYPGAKQWTPLLALRTNRHGRFSFTWSYHAGRGVASYPFAIATTAAESDYPWAATSSRALTVTFGRRTPRRQRSSSPSAPSHHRRHHGRHKRRR